ncbi:Hypothetical predicted protein [Octopus vulgaris]|uniref:Uncharacterized protein n=1 Tax=Octopus vulgaris TaxID=6645 RepID=A0AA36FKG9_OCTVU|nr:Hypothetical predicted protein [Octopus vulgaris]
MRKMKVDGNSTKGNISEKSNEEGDLGPHTQKGSFKKICMALNIIANPSTAEGVPVHSLLLPLLVYRGIQYPL